MDEKPTYQELEKKIHQLEQALQTGKDKYRILLDESSDPTFSFYPDGTYRFVNKAFAEGVGKSVDEIIGHSIWDIFPGEEGDKRFSIVKRVFATGKQKTIEVRVPRPEGDQFYITTIKAVKDNHGKVISVICSSKNITDRKKTEETLRESEARHRLFFENAPIGIIHYSNKGIITAVNEVMVNTFGSSREKLIGLDIDNIPNKKFAKEVYKSLNGKPGYFEGEYSSYTGKKTSFIRAMWIPIKEKDEILAGVGIVEDITERKKAEEALRLSEGTLSAMLASLTDHVSMMDRDLNILWANDNAKRLFGEDLIGKKCYQAFHGKETPCEPYPCLTLKAFEDERMHTHETQVIGKDGQVLYFHCTANVALRDDNGNPTAVIEVSRDITEHKQAEEALHESEEKFRTLVEKSPLGISLIANDGRYKYINPQFTTIFGYTIEDIPTGNAWFKKSYPNAAYRQKVIRDWIEDKKQINLGQARPRVFTVTCKDGAQKKILFRPVTMENHDQFVIYEDITEKSVLEQQLLQSQKFEAIGTLAGGIAHDFNNLLMGIQGRASLMSVDLEPFPFPY